VNEQNTISLTVHVYLYKKWRSYCKYVKIESYFYLIVWETSIIV